jgi:hypothetical protein
MANLITDPVPTEAQAVIIADLIVVVITEAQTVAVIPATIEVLATDVALIIGAIPVEDVVQTIGVARATDVVQDIFLALEEDAISAAIPVLVPLENAPFIPTGDPRLEAAGTFPDLTISPHCLPNTCHKPAANA